METRQQRLIRQALESGSPENDEPGASRDQEPREEHPSSLGQQARRRAATDYTPRTLTPYEWEEFYATQGVPREHRRAAPDGLLAGLARRIKALFP